MSTTQIKSSQILDGTLEEQDFSDVLKKEISKSSVTENDAVPGFLYDKFTAGSNVTLTVVGASGSNQHIEISSTGGAGGGTSVPSGWQISSSIDQVYTTSSVSVGGQLYGLEGAQFFGAALEVTGSLFVSGSSELDGDVTAYGTLYGNGGLELSGDLLTVSGSFVVSGTTDITGPLTVDGAVLTSGMEVTGDELILSGSLFVSGTTSIDGNLDVNGFKVGQGWSDVWTANLTTGQTQQQWSAGSSYSIIDSTSGQTLSWKFNQGSGVTAAMTSEGLKLSYPAGGLSGSNGNVSFSLSDLGLVGLGGRPWRVWIHFSQAGSISSGTDIFQHFVDLSGASTGSLDSMPTYYAKAIERASQTGGYAEFFTKNFGADLNSSDQSWNALDVLCIEQMCGNMTVKMGTYSGGFPLDSEMYAFNCGSANNQFGPYKLSSRIVSRIEATGASPSFSGRSWSIAHVRVQSM